MKLEAESSFHCSFHSHPSLFDFLKVIASELNACQRLPRMEILAETSASYGYQYYEKSRGTVRICLQEQWPSKID